LPNAKILDQVQQACGGQTLWLFCPDNCDTMVHSHMMLLVNIFIYFQNSVSFYRGCIVTSCPYQVSYFIS